MAVRKRVVRRRNPGPWTVEGKGMSWYIVHPTKGATLIGPVQGRGTNYRDKAVAEAEKRNTKAAAAAARRRAKAAIAKRNPQKRFRAKGKVVSFFAKRNPVKRRSFKATILTARDRAHLEAALQRRLYDEEDEGGPEPVMTSKGYVDLWKDGEVVKRGRKIAQLQANPRRTKRRKNPTFRTRSGKTISFRAKTDTKKNPHRRKVKRVSASKLRLNRRRNPGTLPPGWKKSPVGDLWGYRKGKVSGFVWCTPDGVVRINMVGLGSGQKASLASAFAAVSKEIDAEYEAIRGDADRHITSAQHTKIMQTGSGISGSPDIRKNPRPCRRKLKLNRHRKTRVPVS